MCSSDLGAQDRQDGQDRLEDRARPARHEGLQEDAQDGGAQDDGDRGETGPQDGRGGEAHLAFPSEKAGAGSPTAVPPLSGFFSPFPHGTFLYRSLGSI